MKIKTDKTVYGYSKRTGVFVNRIVVREDPLIPGHYPPPAASTPIAPQPMEVGHEAVFDGNKWVGRLIKTRPPSDYHTWDDQIGWSITLEDQVELDIDEQIQVEDEEATRVTREEAEATQKARRDAVKADLEGR